MLIPLTINILKSASPAGTTIAINIPYKAIPKDKSNISGSRLPASAPSNVPTDQPAHGNNIKPIKYFLFISCFWVTATANISSVIPNEQSSLSFKVNFSDNLCERVMPIKKYLAFITTWVKTISKRVPKTTITALPAN